MSFFSIFKKKGRIREKTASIALETQLETLSKLGISPRHDSFVEWLFDDCDRETIERNYWILLFTLGGERELDNGWEALSNDIYCFDMECVEDDDIYASILKKLSFYSKGSFEIENVSSAVSHEKKEASVSFEFRGTMYQWQLHYDGDWFDCTVINRINALLKNVGESKSFYTSSPDQNLLVVYSTDEIIKELNNLVNVPFTLRTADSVAT
jgi:hypothetical protein